MWLYQCDRRYIDMKSKDAPSAHQVGYLQGPNNEFHCEFRLDDIQEALQLVHYLNGGEANWENGKKLKLKV